MATTITYGTPNIGGSGASTTVVGPSCAVGDLLLIVVGYGGGSPVLGAGGITGGAGGTWTELTGFPAGGAPTTTTAITIARKVAASGDSAATFTVNFAQTTQKWNVWVIKVADTNGTATIGASSGKTAATATAQTTNSVTVAAGSLVIAAFTERGATANTWTPGTWTGTATGLTGTERADQSNINSSQVATELQDGNAAVTGGGTVTAAATAAFTQAYSAGIAEIVPAAAAAAVVPDVAMAPMTGA